MPEHAILISTGGVWELAREARLAKELDLQEAVAAHPQVLPSADIGLETLVTLGTGVAVADGEIDMLAADRQGRIAIIEFKKGPENTDVRRVVAQLLDYGSALWQMSVDELQRRCKVEDIATRVAEAHAEEEFDPEAFLSGLEGTLSNGDFVYFYVARVLDKRTRRVLTYLGDGVRLPFIAVEADHFLTDETAVLPPHPAFIPGWMIASGGTRTRPASRSASEILEAAPLSSNQLVSMLDKLATERAWQRQEKASFIYSLDGGPRLYFYPSFETIGLNTAQYVEATSAEDGAELLRRIDDFEGRQVGRAEPSLSKPDRLLENWDRVSTTILIPYVEAQRVSSKAQTVSEQSTKRTP